MNAPDGPEKGAALILALMMLLLLSMLAGALLTLVTADIWIGDSYARDTALLYLTESGIEEARDKLRRSALPPPGTLLIKDELLSDTDGRGAGRYSVTIVRTDPLTLQSTGTIGSMRRTIEVQLHRPGFPPLPQAITLYGDAMVIDGLDPRLNTPAQTERIVQSIAANADEVLEPEWDRAVTLNAVGEPGKHRVVVVRGDCDFGDAAGYGLLLVQGNLSLHGAFAWNGLILVIGQGSVRTNGAAAGSISGAVYVARTRASDRSADNRLGTVLTSRGPVSFDLEGQPIVVEFNAAEVARANAGFPYAVSGYREF